MEKKSRRKFSAEFKAKIVIEALKEKYIIEVHNANRPVTNNSA